jgi:hypothetical protein
MLKRDAAVIVVVVVVLAAIAAFLFLGTDISVYLEQNPPNSAL